jgi:predicted MFS family arabinose efflux permease
MNSAPRTLPWRIPVIFAVTFVIHHLDRNSIAYALPQIAREWGWSDAETGKRGELLLGAFFLTFGFAQVAFSRLAERWGARRSLIGAIFGFSLVSMAVGPLGGSFAVLVVLRLLLGLAESTHVPMMGVMTARNFPPKARALANSVWNVGLIIATALGPAILVPLIAAVGWRGAFVAIGAAGLVVGAPLVILFVDDRGGRKPAPAESGSFRRSADYWLYVAVGVLNAFAGFGVLGWLPTYFVRAKGFDFVSLGWPLTLVFASGVVGALAIAWIGDRLEKRISLAALGLLAASGWLFLAVSASSAPALIALFAAAVFCQSAFQAQEHATLQALAEDREVGDATGLYNGVSVLLGGVVGSVIPGAVIATTGSFNAAVLVIGAGAALGGLLAATLAFRRSEFSR